MKRLALVAAIILFVLFLIIWGVLGLRILDGDHDITALMYAGVACAIGLIVSLIALRWNQWKCPHCGKIRLVNGQYCHHCGKKIG